ncbi:MAG: adaptor protein MecA [Lachnospiraceae bacterium]|nr:adaptor protein MecA [Lachnospiraceae bacterium]
MEFSRDGQHTIRCVITEDEILELGFTIDEIVSNGARTQEFMNQIFDLAEQEFQTKFDMGIKTVRADILPDHTLSLTFSEHPGTEGMMEHLKDIVNGLLSSIPQKKLEEAKSKMNLADMAGFGPNAQSVEKKKVDTEQKTEDADNTKVVEPIKIIALFAFEELETVMRYAKQVKLDNLPFNQLYRFEDAYFLMMDMTGCEESEVRSLSALTDEYSADVFVGSEKRAFIYEHGKCILKERAIEQLREV